MMKIDYILPKNQLNSQGTKSVWHRKLPRN